MEILHTQLLQPLYSISVASELTGVSPVMIREYEKAGMLSPTRVNGKRRFAPADVANITLLRHYLTERQMTLNGLKVLLELAPCFRIKQCDKRDCPARIANGVACSHIASKTKGCAAELCRSCPICLVRGNVGSPATAPPGTPVVARD